MKTPIENLIVPAFIAGFFIFGFIAFSSGISILVTFVPAMVIAYILYVVSVYRKMPEPERIVPVYFLALGVQFLHFAEEFVGRLYERLPDLIDGAPAYDVNLFVVFNMCAYFTFIIGGIGLYKGWRIPMIIVWFFIVMGVAGNAIAHLGLVILAGGYFPGFYTSLVYWILAPILFMRMFGK